MIQIHIEEIKTSTNRILIENLSFTINKGDRIALIGEEGNGKSTLLKIIGHVEDSYISSLHIKKNEQQKNIMFGYLAQQLSTDELNMLANDYLNVSGFISQQHKIYALFLREHLRMNKDDLYRPLSTFSGGEKVKIQILKCMLESVDGYLLDEPTNDLDLETIEWLEAWMLQQQQPILFVSHDVQLLRNISNKIIHLEQRKRKQSAVATYYNGSYSTYVEERKMMIDHTNQVSQKEKEEFQKRMDRWTKLYQKVDHQQNTISRQDPHGGALLKKHMRHLKSQKKQLDKRELTEKIEPEESIELFFNASSERRKGRMMSIDVEQLYVEDHPLGGPYHLDIIYQEKLGIVGKNGVGKTSFIQEILKAALQKNIKVALMEQDYYKTLNPSKSLLDNLIVDKEKDEITRIRNYLGSLKFTPEEMEREVSELSLGQVAKVCLLKLVLEDVDLIILDEPTRNLSPLSFDTITKMFIEVEKTMVCISHDRAFLNQVCDRIVEMREDTFIEKSVIIGS